MKKRLLARGKKSEGGSAWLSLLALMTLAMLFHLSRYRQLTGFYFSCAVRFLQFEFPGLASDDCYLKLLPRCAVPLSALLKNLRGRCTGIIMVDPNSIARCDNPHIYRHRANTVSYCTPWESDCAGRRTFANGLVSCFSAHVAIAMAFPMRTMHGRGVTLNSNTR
jgi:hypothetical protein